MHAQAQEAVRFVVYELRMFAHTYRRLSLISETWGSIGGDVAFEEPTDFIDWTEPPYRPSESPVDEYEEPEDELGMSSGDWRGDEGSLEDGISIPDENAILESFLLHTRALREFFSSVPRNDDIAAGHYFPVAETWDISPEAN
jgi:hypothetical protein